MAAVTSSPLLYLFNAHAGRATGGIMKDRVLPFDLGILSNRGDSVLYFKIVEYGFVWHAKGDSVGVPGYRLTELPEFCCYGGYEPYKFQPTEREYHLLMAGETTALATELEAQTG